MAAKKPKPEKTAPKSGVVYTAVGEDSPKDFITWHDQLPYRYWLHSRLFETNSELPSYRVLSFESQWIGKEGQSEPDKMELSLRMDLAVLRRGGEAVEKLSPTAFRNIQLGALLEAHSTLLTSKRFKSSTKPKKQVQLVKTFESETYKSLFRNEDGSLKDLAPRVKNHELGASKRDSIFIAFLYAQQVEAGSNQPALRTAGLLGLDLKQIYVAVRIARRNKWLTSDGAGKGSGSLTKDGLKAFKELKGQSLYEDFLNNYIKEQQ